MLSVDYMTLLERRVLGHIQVRYGPYRCGPLGLLQPMADGIKAFFKEDLIPGRSDKAIFVIAPMISIISAISIFAVIPFGNQFTIPGTNWVVKLRVADIDIGLLYIFAFASLGEYGVILGGWSSGNKYGLTGSLRAAAQMISYEVALGISIVGVILLSQSLRVTPITSWPCSTIRAAATLLSTPPDMATITCIGAPPPPPPPRPPPPRPRREWWSTRR